VEGGIAERDQLAVSVIHGQAERLHRLIDSMLDLSRLQAGQFEIKPATMDLAMLARRTVDQMQPTIEQHTVTLHCQDEALLIPGDEGRMDEVIQNLLQNAIKYSPLGGPVTVTVKRDGASACLAVSDRGIGIPLAVQSRIFERFYRAWNANPVQVSGLGIGLFVVKEIVTRHGGTVEVESAEGKGSTFKVFLPLNT
jgi:signal transduction histidine kinase